MSSRSGRCIMSDQYLLKTLENAIDVLVVFETEVSLTPKEIKERTKMNRTTLFRILYTLRHEGILQLDAHTGEYSIGMKIIHLASLSLQRIDIKNISQSHLQLLSETIKESIHLVVKSGYVATFIEKINVREDINMGSYVGWNAPLYSTASGKMILSFETDAYIKKYLETIELVKFTDSTIQGYDEIIEDIEAIRKNGDSIDEEAMVEGVTCYAAPIKGHEGQAIATVSTSGPTSRMSKEKEIILKELFKVTAQIC